MFLVCVILVPPLTPLEIGKLSATKKVADV